MLEMTAFSSRLRAFAVKMEKAEKNAKDFPAPGVLWTDSIQNRKDTAHDLALYPLFWYPVST